MDGRVAARISTRRYRAAQGAVGVGALAVGALCVDRLVDAWHPSIFLYYGLDASEYHALQQVDVGVPITVGQVFAAVLALLAVVAFGAHEERRLRREQSCLREHGECPDVRLEALGPHELYQELVVRTSLAGGGLFLAWILQMSTERWLGGYGWGIEYASWQSLLPLASIFGVCLLVGILVAVITLVGMRSMHVLERLARRLAVHRRRRVRVRLRCSPRQTSTTFRDLLGVDILSRPPPPVARVELRVA